MLLDHYLLTQRKVAGKVEKLGKLRTVNYEKIEKAKKMTEKLQKYAAAL